MEQKSQEFNTPEKNKIFMKYIQLIALVISALVVVSCDQETKKVEKKKPTFVVNGFLDNITAKEVDLYHNKKKLKTSKVIDGTFSFTGSVIKSVLYTIKADSTVLARMIFENKAFSLFISPKRCVVYGGGVEQQKIAEYENHIQEFDLQKKVLIDSFLLHHETYKISTLLDSVKAIEDKKFNLSINTISDASSKGLKEFVLMKLVENKELSIAQLDTLKTKITENANWTHLVGQRIDFLKQEEERIKKEQYKKKMLVRRKAPVFTGESLSGDLTSADVIRGKKRILIDFWASWCAPCRQVTPQVKYLYRKYKDKGFDIITISEDKNKSDWKRGIKEDGMNWHHIYDDDMRIAYMFNVLSIPHMILLDEQGRIIKDKISLNDLERELSQLK